MRRLQNVSHYLVDFIQEPTPCFTESFYYSLCSYVVDFSPQFNHFLVSALPEEFASSCLRAFKCPVIC